MLFRPDSVRYFIAEILYACSNLTEAHINVVGILSFIVAFSGQPNNSFLDTETKNSSTKPELTLSSSNENYNNQTVVLFQRRPELLLKQTRIIEAPSKPTCHSTTEQNSEAGRS